MSLAVSHNTIDTARKFLAEVYNVTKEEIPAPSYALMGLWDRYPFGAAWYQWRPYYDWYKVCSFVYPYFKTNRIYDGTKAEPRKSQASFRLLSPMRVTPSKA